MISLLSVDQESNRQTGVSNGSIAATSMTGDTFLTENDDNEPILVPGNAASRVKFSKGKIILSVMSHVSLPLFVLLCMK